MWCTRSDNITNREEIILRIDEIEYKYKNGMSLRQIEEEMNLNRKTISSELKKHGVDIKNIRKVYDLISKDDKLDIIHLHLKGDSNYDIAKKYSCSHQYIEKILIENNIVDVDIPNIIKENEDQIFDLYFNRFLNSEEVREYVNISRGDMIRLFLKNGWEFRNSGRKAIFNYNIFSNINTHEKAYWLGFLFGDGYNNEEKGQVEVNLQYRDKYHLYNFVNFVGGNEYVKVNDKLANIGNNKYKACRVILASQKMSSDLAKLGCIQNKSLVVKYPKINSEFDSGFIAGYFDANGSISRNRISIHSGSEHILNTISQILITNNIIPSGKLMFDTKSKGVSYHLHGKNQAQLFYNYIYSNLDINKCLKRKIDKLSQVF